MPDSVRRPLLDEDLFDSLTQKLDRQERLLRLNTPKRLAGSQAEKRSRKGAAMLLFVGSLSGFLGFLFAALLGFLKFGILNTEPAQKGPDGKPFASGQNYFPATVSEMVYNRDAPAGKVFFGFELIASIAILVSWYPLNLQNVYMDNDKTFWFTGVSWSTLRQFLPSIGMMIVASIPETPMERALLPDRITVWVHTVGAVMAIGGYVWIEAKTLLHFGALDHLLKFREAQMTEKATESNSTKSASTAISPYAAHVDHARLSPKELKVRWLFMFISMGSLIFFEIFSFLRFNGHRFGICCYDDWHKPSPEDIKDAHDRLDLPHLLAMQIAQDEGRNILYNTASGWGLAIKQLSFWCECISGLCLIANQLAIWWFCGERKVDMTFELPLIAPRPFTEIETDTEDFQMSQTLQPLGQDSQEHESGKRPQLQDMNRFTLTGPLDFGDVEKKQQSNQPRDLMDLYPSAVEGELIVHSKDVTFDPILEK